MINNDTEHAPSIAGSVTDPVAAAAGSRTADLIPQLRRVARERFSRMSICRYLGVHPNTLQRLSDPTWHPRLDTLQRIELFLDRAESPEFRLAGKGWRLAYQRSRPIIAEDGMWLIERGAKKALGPFVDPDLALAAGEAFEQETNLGTKND